MQTQVRSWGNSQGVILTKSMLKDAGIKLNDTLDVIINDGSILLCRPTRHQTLEERAAAYAGKLNLNGEFDWGEPAGREIW